MPDIEYEVKIKLSEYNIEELEKTILSKGFLLEKETEQTDIYFVHPNKDFSQTDEALRIRYEDDANPVVTYKGPKKGNRGKVRVEINVKCLDNPNDLFLFLGFKEYGKVKKKRKVFVRNGIEIMLDNVENLGVFMEIECKTKEDWDKIDEIKKEISIEEFEEERTSYLELLYGEEV